MGWMSGPRIFERDAQPSFGIDQGDQRRFPVLSLNRLIHACRGRFGEVLVLALLECAHTLTNDRRRPAVLLCCERLSPPHQPHLEV